MYNIAICDDEIIFANNLKLMTKEVLLELGIDYTITVYTKALELLNVLNKNPNQYNLILLDILLGSQNGIKLGKLLRQKENNVSILLISSSKEFALDGYTIYPIHYLLKPINKKQLLDVIYKEYKEKFSTRYITISERNNSTVIELNNIFYIEFLNRKILIHTSDKDFETPGTLKNFSQALPDDIFVQCHKSFVVNISKICKVSKTNFSLKNGTTIPVGRIYYQNAISKFISYIEKE